ncbi:hypothetical protein IU450_36100 [Nocardia abscessus]|uniref:hypothetical protein n=1 Tax=Nocardia abscessus TaxID=120957 RepID=UPI001895D6E8|nr:hypothetical protein [Nocardia abscessus]MBF6341265.1 hypothetical protein [Nocardia abscessus]
MRRPSGGDLGCLISRACPEILLIAAGIATMSVYLRVHAYVWLACIPLPAAAPVLYFRHRDTARCRKCAPARFLAPSPRQLRTGRRLHIMEDVFRRVWVALYLAMLLAAVCVAIVPATVAVFIIWIFIATIAADGLRVWADREHRSSACPCSSRGDADPSSL